MKYSLHSQNLNALLPQGNYNLILNEQSRLNKYTHSQNIIYVEEFDLGQKTRRKSCHCSECGVQNQFQYKMMNVPLKPEQRSPKQKPSIPQLIVTSIESRKSSYLKSSYKCMKEPPNTMKLSLEIYGVRKNISRQNTLLKLITDGQERSKRRESSGLFSSLDFNSQNSLNMTVSPKLQSPIMHKQSIVKPTKSLHHKKKPNILLKPLRHLPSHSLTTLPRLSHKKLP